MSRIEVESVDDDAVWQPYEGGSSLGWMGTQGGTIARDEALRDQLRLTYERDDSRSFHAISCSVTGWLLYHRFFDNADAAHAAFEEMKPALLDLLAQLPEGGASPPGNARLAGPLLAAFTVRYG
ncbi:hypothetical protein [Comamonas sp. JC664]|uniref:hypothetical protein n=1 Tax=Comamonas sp. JC664 TaxID=2801917 RepID=UPI001749CE9E|nr:hypothetical protein [Comamonas sp. JC664]MBL0694614.1 hypothetical protein [Comamonas sp. JC664]GHG96262.1 hypothetical protein GCM10012319_60590 [Comamonas sp. KCTC 72670]